MLGIRYGYYTEDPLKAHAIDSICDYVESMMPPLQAYMNPCMKGEAPSTDCEDVLNNYWKKYVSVIGTRLNAHDKPFIAGTDRPTIADFKAMYGARISLKHFNQACMVPEEVQEKIKAVCDTYPRFKAWLMAMRQEEDNYIKTVAARPV